MRRCRLKGIGRSYYHCMSRINHREYLLDDISKEYFRKLMRKVEGFCDVCVLTYALMDNHFHILVEVPESETEISDEELYRRMGFLYDKRAIMEVEAEIEKWCEQGRDDIAERIRKRYLVRMHDVSEFMKTLKQRFTQHYNAANGMNGVLWNDRFKSVLVENSEHALTTMAAYIDLNPVRAGLTKDPKEYRYCGYADAVAGGACAKTGLMSLVQAFGRIEEWPEASALYRKHLYCAGEEKGLSAEEVEHVLEENGELSLDQILRCRVRYFSDGVALGSKEFVNSVFDRYREKFGLKRKTGARAMKHGKWGELCSMRDLRKEPVAPPSPD